MKIQFYFTDLKNSKLFTCDKCSSSFKNKKNLIAHQRDKHGKYIYVYRCPECNKACTTKYSLHIHCEHAHGEITLDAETCKDQIVNTQKGRHDFAWKIEKLYN